MSVKFRKFQPRYSYKMISYKKKTQKQETSVWLNQGGGAPVPIALIFTCFLTKNLTGDRTPRISANLQSDFDRHT